LVVLYGMVWLEGFLGFELRVVRLKLTMNSVKIVAQFGKVQAVPRLCELYPGISLATEEKARKNLSQGS